MKDDKTELEIIEDGDNDVVDIVAQSSVVTLDVLESGDDETVNIFADSEEESTVVVSEVIESVIAVEEPKEIKLEKEVIKEVIKEITVVEKPTSDWNDLENKPQLIDSHSDLAGLNKDDHPQYLTKKEATKEYATKESNDELVTKADAKKLLDKKENKLGNPSQDGLVLSSSKSGKRKWIPQETAVVSTGGGSQSDSLSAKVLYVFEDTTERDAFFTTNPSALIVDALIAIKDTTPPPTAGVRSYDFSKAYNSQYKLTGI